MSTPDRSHERLEELIAADVLYGLDEPDRVEMEREMADHGPDCLECRRLVQEYGEVAGGLGLALEPLPLAAGAEDRLLAAARLTDRRPAQERAPSVVRPLAPAAAAPGRARRWIAAAAVAAAIAVLAGFVGYALAPGAPALRVAAFPAKGGQQLSVVYQAGSRQAVVVGSNLASLPPGRVYELWYVPTPGADPRPAGTFLPRAGSVVANAHVGTTFVALAVSVEPKGGSPHPTTTPILLTTV